MTDERPREFWIRESRCTGRQKAHKTWLECISETETNDEDIHVIEYSAYDALAKQVEILTRVLEKARQEDASLHRESIAHITDLQSKLTTATEALEFYASQDNWVVTPNKESNLWAYTTIYDDSASCDSLTGGKRAREALAKIKGEEK